MSKKMGLALLLCFWLSLSMGITGAAGETGHGTMNGGEGHDVPTPFEMVNQRFELAEGEIYALVGTVTLAYNYTDSGFKADPYLVLDLKKMGWLASAKRIEAPYYLLEGSSAQWGHYQGRRIKILAKARGNIISEKYKPEYILSLEPIAIEPK